MEILETLNKNIEKINLYITDYLLIVLLFGCGIFFSVKTKFVQIRCFKEGISRLFSGSRDSERSSFGALMTAVGAQIGTGNIVGAASAILIGGAGSVFWMWISAFFGMAVIYSEAVLAQKTAVYNGKERVGGPHYYIKKSIHGKIGHILAILFSVSTVVSLSFSGAMVQANAVAGAVEDSFGIDTVFVGILLSGLCLLIYLGGTRKLVSLTEKLVPTMSITFVLVCVVVIISRIEYFDNIIFDIFHGAFYPKSVVGGGVGVSIKSCISQGIKKGIFSNEAGLGSTPHAHAFADVDTPHAQGTVAMIGVFIDTFIILSLTSFAMIGFTYEVHSSNYISENNFLLLSFKNVFGNTVSCYLVTIALFVFGFTSIITWNYFGLINYRILFNGKYLIIFFILSALFIFIGSIINNAIVWNISDLFLIFMIFPNIIALIRSLRVILSEINSA